MRSFAQNGATQASYLRLNVFAHWGDSGQGTIVTSVAVDLYQHIWAGTEDTGVWEGTPLRNGAITWTNFSIDNGLSDTTCTALLADSEGRLWAGTLNHGVSVYNGKFWQNYSTANGPLGTHIFAIAQNPIDQSIWIATENGLSRYDQSSGAWTYFTKADGLPSNQPDSIVFDSTGHIYAGTQCDGIGISSAASGYKTWRTVSGPFRPTHAAGGTGIPSECINAMTIASSGVLYVSTDWGLAETTDSGTTWHYIRGDDWKAIAQGEYPPPTAPLPAAQNATLLSDYVTCLAQDQSGNLWVGHRDYGAEVFDTANFLRTGQTSTSAGDFVTAMVPSAEGMLFATYGSGLAVLASDPSLPANASPVMTQLPALPSQAGPPSIADLTALQQKITNLSNTITPGGAAYLGDDWDTQGNWVAHYGLAYCRVSEQTNWGGFEYTSDPAITTNLFLGPTSMAGDYLAMWTGAQQELNNRNALFEIDQGYRGIYNWNDNNEVYPVTTGGGDLWYTVTVPAGVFKLSTYFFNNDGDGGSNRDRDYLEEVRPHAADTSKIDLSTPPLAVARIVDFRHGVYKSFVVCGPASYDVRVNRNGSFNGMMEAIFLDPLSSAGPAASPSYLHGVDYSVPISTAQPNGSTASSSYAAAIALWKSLFSSYKFIDYYPIDQETRLLAYRSAQSSTNADDNTLEAMRWLTHTWTAQDNLKFTILTAKASSLSK